MKAMSKWPMSKREQRIRRIGSKIEDIISAILFASLVIGMLIIYFGSAFMILACDYSWVSC